jgi:hypothetical protein
MIKTYTSGSLTNKVELRIDSSHGAIVILEQNGKSLQNEWGGYPVLNVGKAEYLKKIWNKLN